MSNWASQGDTRDDEPVPNGGIRVRKGSLSFFLARKTRDSRSQATMQVEER